jgi:hypothetical protein
LNDKEEFEALGINIKEEYYQEYETDAGTIVKIIGYQ